MSSNHDRNYFSLFSLFVLIYAYLKFHSTKAVKLQGIALLFSEEISIVEEHDGQRPETDIFYPGMINFNSTMSKERINVFVRIKPTDEPSMWSIISPEEIVLNEPGKIPYSFSLCLYSHYFYRI